MLCRAVWSDLLLCSTSSPGKCPFISASEKGLRAENASAGLAELGSCDGAANFDSESAHSLTAEGCAPPLHGHSGACSYMGKEGTGAGAQRMCPPPRPINEAHLHFTGVRKL